MKMIMANLDADYLCTVRTELTLEELRKYVNIPAEGRSALKKRAEKPMSVFLFLSLICINPSLFLAS